MLAGLLMPAASQAHGNVFGGEGAHAPIWLSQGWFALAWLTYLIGACAPSPPKTLPCACDAAGISRP
ncbi:MAG: hypothetical protein EOP73_10325, partial [Variovorax sp.]